MPPFRRSLIALLAFSLILALAAPAAADHLARQTDPVTVYSRGGFGTGSQPYIPIDPQGCFAGSCLGMVDSFFVGLTDNHPATGEPTPELATSWTVSDDGLVWTFLLRDDVPWVRWNPVSEEGTVIRMVTADDVAYGIQRACDPRVNAPAQHIVASVVAGCEQFARIAPDAVSNDDYQMVGVQALDDTTLQITLQHAAGYFLSMTPMAVFRPVPREIVEQHGDTWTDIEFIVTSGPFMLDEWLPTERQVRLRSPFFPADLQGPGNIERVIEFVLPDETQQIAMFRASQIDWTLLPPAEVETMRNDPDYGAYVIQRYNPVIGYYGLAHDKPPLDNVHVRRAFSAMLDRDTLVEPGSVPMRHFTPPGIFGAPPVDEVGVGFDPDYSRAQLALAGYPDCAGLPPIIVANVSGNSMGSAFVHAAETVLGCDPALFTVEELDFRVLTELTASPIPSADRPHVWLMGWGADYPDAQNFIGDVLNCGANTPFRRPCSVVDDLIFQAAVEPDPLTRVELYRDIEERFFGPDGEVPVIPFAMGASTYVHQPWYTGPHATDALFGAVHYDWYTVDQEMQLAARGQE